LGAPDARTLAAMEPSTSEAHQGGPSAEGLLEAAFEAIDAAGNLGVRMRLLGGIAVRHLAPSAHQPPLARAYHDYDVAVSSRDGAQAAKIFRALGYREDPHFNALHGAQRMIFESPKGFEVDVLVGSFQMCHRLDLGSDLPDAGMTVYPADLLLTKLQIVQIEHKDLRDTAALLHDLPVGVGDGTTINPERFVRPLASDWGFYHTVELNLDKVAAYANRALTSGMAAKVLGALSRLGTSMEGTKKSVKWKMRARIGEKVSWYELPEDV
jgi:hypothetical protein